MFLSLALALTSPTSVDGFSGLKSAVAACGDLNGDGVPDLLLASRDYPHPECVWLLSGKDGSVLRTLKGRVLGDGFGERVTGIGDVDADGIPDIAVGSFGKDPAVPVKTDWRAVSFGPYTRIFSGKSGDILMDLPSDGDIALARDVDADGRADLLFSGPGLAVTLRYGDPAKPKLEIRDTDGPIVGRFGDAVSWTGDLDGDGHPDIAASTVGIRTNIDGSPGKDCFAVTAFSSRDGHRLWNYLDTTDGEGGASILRKLSDVDGDGVDDLLVGLEDCYVATLSGKTGENIRLLGAARRDVVYAFASSLDVIGDVDKDGFPDWVVGALEWLPRPFFDLGTAGVYSGKKGTRILDLEYSYDFGFDVSAIGDVDGDGVPDVAEYVQGSDSLFVGAAKVRSGKTGEVIWLKTLPELRAAAPR